MNNLAH